MSDSETQAETPVDDRKILAVCLPLYDGKLHWETWFRLREEEYQLAMQGVPWRIDPIILAGCSAIHIARNDLVGEALDRGADRILWVDGDMNWSAGAIARLLAHDVDIVGAAVPRKEATISWNVRFLDDADPAEVLPHPEKGLIEVATLGTGFMMIKRRVFELLAERLPPTYAYKDRDTGKKRTVFYEAPLAWGEDTRFCNLWREQVGGKIWVDPQIAMQHIIAPKWSVTAQLASWLEEKRAAAATAVAA